MALINLRNALMTGKRLPYDAELEYLESDGYAYAVAPNNIFSKHTGVRVELTLSTGSATLSAVSVLLAAGGDIQGPPYYYRVAIDKTTQFASPGVTWFSLFTDGDVHTVSTTNVNLTNTGIYSNTVVDGTRVLNSSYSNANKTFDDTVGIFAFNNGNNKCPAGIRIYSIVAFDENGNKTADFIPVRKGTTGYLYDRVSGRLFGNAGTGDFVLGPDVVPVEYIESHGTEWINSGVIGEPNIIVEAVYSWGANAFRADNCLVGSNNTSANNRFIPIISNNRKSVQIGAGDGWLFASPTILYDKNITYTARSEFVSGSVRFTLDGTTVITSGKALTSTQLNMFIFASNENGGRGRLANAKLNMMKIIKDNTLVRSFLPVRVGTDGAMMDVLTRRIYRNAGTGAFGYGNDLKYPIPAA